MTAILNLTAALMLVLHTALGCCWHHGHATSEEIADPLAKSPTHCCGHGPRAPIGHDSSGDSPAEHDDAPCHEAPCSLVAVTASHMAAPDGAHLPAPLWFAPIEPSALSAALQSQPTFGTGLRSGGPPGIPLRLLFGALRI